jgi:hypothetical protein
MQFTKDRLRAASLAITVAITGVVIGCQGDNNPTEPAPTGPELAAKGPLNPALVAQGRTIFRCR